MIKNLSQLKKTLIAGTSFTITEHCRSEVIGEQRMVNYADTTGIYTITPSNLGSKVSQANNSKGSFLGWSKAVFWEFRDSGICALYSSQTEKTAETLIIAIRVFD